MRNIPEFHRLNKTKTAEMSKEELKRRLEEEARKSAKKGFHNKQNALERKKQERISEEARRQLPPKSPLKRQREEERLRAQRERERREKELKKRHRRRGSNIIYYTFLAIVLVVTLIVLSFTVFFKLEHIDVSGESVYTEEQIVSASGIELEQNLIKLDLSGVRERIMEKLVMLDDVKVNKAFPSGVMITVTPARAMANFLYGGRYYTISHTGRVIKLARTPDNCLRVVGYIPKETVREGDFVTAADGKQDELIRVLCEAVDNSGIEGIRTINIADDLGIILVCQDRINIKIGAPLDIDEKLTMARELIQNYIGETEHVQLDISDMSRVVQKPLTEAAPVIAAVTASTEQTDTQAEEQGEQTSAQ